MKLSKGIQFFAGSTQTTYDLTNLNLSAGNYAITVVAEAEGFTDSDASNSVNYTVQAQLAAPTIAMNADGKTLEITDVTNATSYDMYVDGTLKTNVASAPNTTTFDLSTLSDITDGAHTVKVKAKADGYRDSEFSNEVSYTKATPSLTDSILFEGETSDFTLKATNKEWDGTVEYSTDKNTWNTWNGSEISSANKKLYLRGKNNTKFYTSNGVRFVLSAKAGCYGNINTLLDYENPPTALAASCYRRMFYGCTSLTTAPELPATTIADYCYHQMFYGCTSLTTAPELPATTIADYCYKEMFKGCTSLTTAPELPATTLASSCYESMFYGCTSLTTGLSILPATTLASSCYYNMFQNCTSLTTAPELPATTLASSCYKEMFKGCISLTTAPELPATTLANYCYQSMFQSCTGLTTAPALPATTLATYCYYSMFNGCTSLTTAPELPATKLAYGCYYSMFQSCTGLKISATQTGEYTTAWRIPSAGEIAAEETDWNSSMLAGTGGTFTANPSINTTYYIAA